MRTALHVLECATGLLKAARAADFVLYYIGTLPFLWLVTQFWAEMSRSANASRHLWSRAFGLALAYVWMKVWQTYFVQRLLLILRDEPRRWSFREWVRIGRRAAIVQTSALAVTVFATCLLIPTAWTFAFYHHAQCSADPEQKDVMSSVRAALAQSQLWPRQNHTLLSLHSAFGVLVFLNIWVTLLVLPQLLHSLFGVETRLLTSTVIPYNSTLLAAAFALTWAFADPFLKAAYAVRTFQAQSVTTGRDLSVAWQRSLVKRSLGIGLLIGILLLPRFAWAEPLTTTREDSIATDVNVAIPNPNAYESIDSKHQELSLEAQRLDRQLTEVLKRPVFAWRMPREAIDEADEQPGFIRQWLGDVYRSMSGSIQKVGGWIVDLVKWLLSLNRPDEVPVVSSSSGWGKLADRSTVVLASIAILVPLLVLLRRFWKTRAPARPDAVAVRAEAPSVGEGTEAAKLPAAEWQHQAEQLLLRGERRLALRAMFLGELSFLIQTGNLVAASHKSIGDYRRDLERRIHVHPNAYQGYCTTAQLFESVWYGNLSVTDAVLERFASGVAILRLDA